ncbi:helix-turn-helix domain-containing protein [Aquimarina sp. 2201CG5-10]|uniref:helix-turn-helix domain-containing protein n=1 Tax=Aquimarina callyspongiae TaxID=3098150 RepID=UPI002AB5091E|nr:helix-turn-helix domain-containing protein [Aquimarina sp. 2201CG5-10]MDY8135098.1 helix-turn-helix domain-containing protein [Aquimarina sp. 2201CG5-10]
MDIKKNSGKRKEKKVFSLILIACIFFLTLNIVSETSPLLVTLDHSYWYLLPIFSSVIFFMFPPNKTIQYSLINNLPYNSFGIGTALAETFNTNRKSSLNSTEQRKKRLQSEESKKNKSTIVSIPYLNEVFSEFDDESLYKAPIETLSILSYFATSLFEKNNTNDVLWDIVENCISHLYLEDCVIYMLDKEKKFLIQKAAFGNKNNGEKKIISPIKIKVGEGIVGNVAKSGTYQYNPDVSKNPQYIIDDIHRMSELSVPIFIENNVIGVLDSEHSEKDFFTNDHIFLFHLIAKLTEKKLKQIHTTTTCHITTNNVYFKELEFLMKEAKLYRDPNLGLESVAKRLKISSNYLSQLVNKLTDQNFADYINSFRVEDAKSKLRNTNFINYTIVSIALEAGFNSKSTFYSAFKKITGVSPSIYRKVS